MGIFGNKYQKGFCGDKGVSIFFSASDSVKNGGFY